ncbi:MAG: phosphomannomutase, partial [Pseudomonadota bacterium]
GPLAPLITRDCTLPLLTVLYASREGGVAARVAQEPPVVTVADRLQEVSQDRSGPFIAALSKDPSARQSFLQALGGAEATCDFTDGIRMTLQDGRVVHIRPSGNAPELRLYVEAQDPEDAQTLLTEGLALLRQNF